LFLLHSSAGRQHGGPVKMRGVMYAPDSVVATFFSEAGADSSALLLDDGSLVGDGLCGANIADELLDCGVGGNAMSAGSVFGAGGARTGTHGEALKGPRGGLVGVGSARTRRCGKGEFKPLLPALVVVCGIPKLCRLGVV
jgi:hypothetical protein